jgi:hypothetical protein
VLDEAELREIYTVQALVTDSDLDDERALREAMLEAPEKATELLGASAVQIDDMEGAALTVSVSSTLASYTQESRTWSTGNSTGTGKCVAGCSPVAAAIVMQYWDRKTHPLLVGLTTDQENWSTTDTDVRSMIDDMRDYMDTYCESDGSTGWTSTSKIGPGVHAYMVSRGARSSSIAATYTTSTFEKMAGQVLLNFPPIVNFSPGSSGHSAVAYRYIDNAGTSTDQYCVMTGWSSATACYGRYSSPISSMVQILPV